MINYSSSGWSARGVQTAEKLSILRESVLRKMRAPGPLTRRTSREGLLDGTGQNVDKDCKRVPSVANSHESLCNEDCVRTRLVTSGSPGSGQARLSPSSADVCGCRMHFCHLSVTASGRYSLC